MVFGNRGPWQNRMSFSQEAEPCVGALYMGFISTLRAVASKRKQQRYPEHPSLLTYGTEGDIDPADPEELFLPGLLSGVLFNDGFSFSEDLTT